MEPATPTISVVSGMFWSRSLWTAVPVILRLDGEILTLKTNTEIVFQVPIDQTTCRFTLFGTMLIKVMQKDYKFYATGNGFNATLSKEQLNEISEAQGQGHAVADMVYRVASGVGRAGTGLGAAGDVVALASYGKATDENVSTWQKEFGSRNLLIPSKIKLRPSTVIVLMVVVAIIVGLAMIFIAP